jgi:hypothetical protein
VGGVKSWSAPVEESDMNEKKDSFGPHPTHCCAKHGCKYGHETCPVGTGEAAQVYPCEECDMNENDKSRMHRDHIGPTAEDYMAAHPEVDWDTHEVLYTVVEMDIPNGIFVTEIKSHWEKPDYEALHAELRRLDEFERVLLRTPSASEVVLKAGFFRQIYTDHCKLMALEAAGVDNWDGYDDALANMTDDNWAKEITSGGE